MCLWRCWWLIVCRCLVCVWVCVCWPRHSIITTKKHRETRKQTQTNTNNKTPKPTHLLELELLDARLVGRDRRALDADVVLQDRLGRLDRHAVVGRVAVGQPQVEVLDVEVEVGVDLYIVLIVCLFFCVDCLLFLVCIV